MEKKYLDFEGLKEVFQIIKKREAQLESDVTLILNGMAEALEKKADKDEIPDFSGGSCDCEAMTEDEIMESIGEFAPPKPKVDFTSDTDLNEVIVDPSNLTITVSSTVETITSLIVSCNGIVTESYDIVKGETGVFTSPNRDKGSSFELNFNTNDMSIYEYLSQKDNDKINVTITAFTSNGDISKSFSIQISGVDYFNPDLYTEEGEYVVLTPSNTSLTSNMRCLVSEGYKIYGYSYFCQNRTTLEYVKAHDFLDGGNNRNLFDGCTNLKYVDLSNSNLNGTTSATRWFADCPNLEILCLRGCTSTSMPSNFSTNAFLGTDNIKILDLRDANISWNIESYINAERVLK